METIDLSHLSGSPKAVFKKEFQLGKEEVHLEVNLNQYGDDEWRIWGYYSDQTKYRTFRRVYELKAVPARLTRGIVRLGASEACMLRIAAAYAEILAAVSGVRPDQLHTDNPEYDF